MFRVICKKCSSTGFSASTAALCECGGKCRALRAKKGSVQCKVKPREVNVIDYHWNRLYKVLFDKMG